MGAIPETGLKGIIQAMTESGEKLLQGNVISISPLRIQMVNDEKLIITERITIVPQHLTDYQVIMSASLITSYEEEHSHSVNVNNLFTVRNALKVGDRVIVLSLNKGKLYYVLDRVG